MDSADPVMGLDVAWDETNINYISTGFGGADAPVVQVFKPIHPTMTVTGINSLSALRDKVWGMFESLAGLNPSKQVVKMIKLLQARESISDLFTDVPMTNRNKVFESAHVLELLAKHLHVDFVGSSAWYFLKGNDYDQQFENAGGRLYSLSIQAGIEVLLATETSWFSRLEIARTFIDDLIGKKQDC